MDWKGFFKALVHAAIGGGAAGIASAGVGASWKQAGAAALGGAITSIFSLFSKSPAAAPAK